KPTFSTDDFRQFHYDIYTILIISLVLSIFFKNKKLQLLTASLLIWDFANCIFYQFDNGTNTLYMVFFYAMFGQIFLILLWVFLKK
ncbi:MAG: hypothetical protein ACI4U5_02805, partial [Bacilli bacterium]